MHPASANVVTIRFGQGCRLPCFFVYYILCIYAVLEFPEGLENLKTFTTIWSKVFAPQRALVSVLSSPLWTFMENWGYQGSSLTDNQ